MKKICTDFNNPNPYRIRIPDFDMDYFELVDGEKVILYAEDIQVEAKIMYDSEQSSWCGELTSEYMDVSKDIEEARDDGFINGKAFGIWKERADLMRRMIELKIDPQIIAEIIGVSKEEILRRYD
ncbi:hypothetical protein PO903_21305 [Paenibacillus sp. PK4536]|uniref:hypothetical protein n=1 Tax=Paenibacillus sp. PK4536 TaxID=3024576 RepID=UPI002359E088|nr:hypothetical protein [Paenibacillus sp. PK4536]WIM39154.1 hypothetical protein PO903_21305 [Paenibacillus sp. PK4536]